MFKYNDRLTIYFPLKLNPRKQQLEMLKFTANSINNANKNILLNASTGVGKSYFAVMFMNWYRNNINPEAKFDILTNSKILQDQYLRDFDFIKNLKGKSNYYCETFSTDCDQGKDLCKILNCKCDKCPYDQAKKEWLMSDVSLTNFQYFCTLSLYQKEMLKQRKSSVLIIDEAHDFENVFSDYISAKISSKLLKKYGFDNNEIKELDKQIKKIKKMEEYVTFLQYTLIPSIKQKSEDLSEIMSNDPTSKKNKELSKQYNYCVGQKEKFSYFINDYIRKMSADDVTDPKSNWILEINKIKDEMFSGIEIHAQPVWVSKYLPLHVWNKYDHIIFMSGTILNRELFSFINGLKPEITTYLEIDSPFDLKNRPVYYIKVGKMTFDEKVETFEKQKEVIKMILEKHKKDKGIIHTTNYEISKWIQEKIYDDRLLFHETVDRHLILDEHMETSGNTVIVSPSMTTGIDLYDELSRFQILAKIPFPNISSKKIKARQNTNKTYYAWKTAVDIIQSLGRSVRSEKDYAESYIIDSCLSDFLKYNGNLIPRYISDAIQIKNINEI